MTTANRIDPTTCVRLATELHRLSLLETEMIGDTPVLSLDVIPGLSDIEMSIDRTAGELAKAVDYYVSYGGSREDLLRGCECPDAEEILAACWEAAN